MKPFTAKFKACHIDLGVIISPLDGSDERFKAEMITGEPNPAILKRSNSDVWLIENPGNWTISEDGFQKLGQAIDKYVKKIYSMETVLVLTDFSDAASNAAQYAAALTHQLRTSCIFLYHSYRFIPVPELIAITSPLETDDSQKESMDHLNDLKDNLLPVVREETVIEIFTDERPLTSAVQLIAEQHHAGLVVMGITGKSSLEQMLVGSNVLTIAKECYVPLLIVPKEAKFENIRRILFACDLKEVLKTIPVHTIKTLIHTLNAKLVILNVKQEKSEHFNLETVPEQSVLQALWGSEEPEYHYIEHQDTAAGIMQFADEHDIQLVVTVPKKYGFFETLFHRSLTKKLAFHTHIPLLLLEEDI